HTGPLIGDFATIRTQVEDAGVVAVHSMDEMMDLVEFLVRYPVPPTKGPGILTASGAYVALTNDFADEAGLELPKLDAATLKKVREVLPAYGITAIRSTRLPVSRWMRCRSRSRRCSTIPTSGCCSSRSP